MGAAFGQEVFDIAWRFHQESLPRLQRIGARIDGDSALAGNRVLKYVLSFLGIQEIDHISLGMFPILPADGDKRIIILI